MAGSRATEILESITSRYYVIPPSLDETDTYPIVVADDVERLVFGVNATNDHASDSMTIVIVDANGTHTKNILAGKPYSGFFDHVISVDVTAGTTYQIELLGL